MYWNLFEQLSDVRREMDRLFGEIDRERIPFSRVSFLPGRAARRYPLINLSEDKDHVYVEALAPGVKPESLDVTVLQRTLTITGEKQLNEKEVNPESYHRNERAAGKFIRTIELPMEVDSNKVSADYRNGLLMIVLPKSEKAKPKQIDITVS